MKDLQIELAILLMWAALLKDTTSLNCTSGITPLPHLSKVPIQEESKDGWKEEEEEKEEGMEEEENDYDDEDNEKKRALCHTKNTIYPSFSLYGLQLIIFWMQMSKLVY